MFYVVYQLFQQFLPFARNSSVQDTQAPVLSGVPSSATVMCNAVPAAPTVTAADNCDGAPVLASSTTRQNGTCVDRYVLVRTWLATDACGNTMPASQTLTVQV